MKIIPLFILFFYLPSSVFAQGAPMHPDKQPVEAPAFFNWPSLENKPAPAISNNGQFALYAVRNAIPGRRSLTVQALHNNEKTVLPEVAQAAFTADSRYAVALQSGDSLCLLTLPGLSKAYITGVTGFRLFTRGGAEWLAYTTKASGKKLALRNITTGEETTYQDVDSYLLSENALVLQSTLAADSARSIRWIDLSTNTTREIWKGRQDSSLVLNNNGTQLAFLVHDTAKTLWLYRSGQEKATNLSPALPENLELDSLHGFSKDGSQLFVQLRQKPLPKKVPPIVSVDVWSYTDAKLQSQQLYELSLGMPCYLAALDLSAPSSFRRLQFEDETIDARTDSLLLLTYRRGDISERYWNRLAIGTFYLVTVNTGKRTEIPISWPRFSPEGKYVIGYGKEEIPGADLYVYDRATGATRNITANLPIPLQDEENDMLGTQQSRGLSIAGWLENESAVLIYDTYDIWRIDPTGTRPPLNLTNGRKDKWQFRLAAKETTNAFPLILTGFNKTTKQNGFYNLSSGETNRIEQLFAGDYHFSGPDSRTHFLKARDTAVYLIKRESATESPNIFATADFKSFTPLSSLAPERSVNWLTTELISFNTLDGVPSQAILYKPENFNPSRKYPMIIHYLEKKSDELNWYRHPVVDNGGELDIAWFVSHGYLVLLPDIHYKIGEPGPSALKAVEGAALFMARRPYVDKKRIGIQGHGFGGYETNYIATHSKLFAAAMSSAGVCNLTSDFGNIWPNESSKQGYWEVGEGRMGTTPWENTDLFVKNSPVFYIGDITAPILTMYNRNDKIIHFQEGIQFSTGLRRAGKRSWMLEYDNGAHGVTGNDYKDYLVRMTQFFDHYLKGAPAPKWMTRGVPYIMREIDSGLELDTEITTPGPGLLIEEKDPAVKTLSRRAH
jgi:dipeptidyl aminopeptidase/acylaminoacyl peptidase